MKGAAIFDVDGTLIDSVDQHAKAWQEAFAQFGHKVGYRKIRSQIGKGGDQILPLFISPLAVRKHGKEIEAARSAIFRVRYLEKIRAFPQVRVLFLRLRAAGWKVAVASSAKRKELKIYEKKCRIESLLDAETSADDARRSKPHPDIFLATVRQLHGVLPQHCVVVGDSPFDAKAAKKAGMHSIGFMSGGFSRAKLRKAGAEELYRDPADLLRNLGKSLFDFE